MARHVAKSKAKAWSSLGSKLQAARSDCYPSQPTPPKTREASPLQTRCVARTSAGGRQSPLGRGRPHDASDQESVNVDVEQRSQCTEQTLLAPPRSLSAPGLRDIGSSAQSTLTEQCSVTSRGRSRSPPSGSRLGANASLEARGDLSICQPLHSSGEQRPSSALHSKGKFSSRSLSPPLSSSKNSDRDSGRLGTQRSQHPAQIVTATQSQKSSKSSSHPCISDRSPSVDTASHCVESARNQRALPASKRQQNLGRLNRSSHHNKAPGTALQRLQDKGFSTEAARVALHATGGDELRALELCMAGLSGNQTSKLSTVSTERNIKGSRASSSKPRSPKLLQSQQFCYICGALQLTTKMLEIHTKACRRHFELCESKFPLSQRRVLLDKSDLPAGFTCLERYYESITAFTSKARRSKERCSLDDWIMNLKEDLPRCPSIAEKDAQVARSTTEAVLGSKVGKVCDPATRGCHPQLEKCPGCVRSFPPKLLQLHVKKCPVLIEINAGEKATRERQHLKQTYCKVAAKVFEPPRGSVELDSIASSSDGNFMTSSVLLERGLIAHAAPEAETKLRSELARGMPGAEFVAGFRVLSAAQKGIYDAMKANFQAQHASGVAPEERELWHGTSWAIIEKILQQGFNRIFAGRHGKLLGVATYFSNDLAYSHRFCDRSGRGEDQTKIMIMARVLIGRYCKGRTTDIEPPLIEAGEHARYDSTVDKEDNPQIFAVFKDFQALPLYLLEFRS